MIDIDLYVMIYPLKLSTNLRQADHEFRVNPNFRDSAIPSKSKQIYSMLWCSITGCFFFNKITSFIKECLSSQYLCFKGIIDFYLAIEQQNVTVNKKEHLLLNVNSKN